MTNISDVIREYIANGGTTEELAAEFSNALNDIEKTAAEEEAIRSTAQEEIDTYCDECFNIFFNNLEKVSKFSPMDVANFAVWMAYTNAPEGWTIDNYINFHDSIASTVKLNMDLMNKSIDEMADIASEHIAKEFDNFLRTMKINNSKDEEEKKTCGTDRNSTDVPPARKECTCPTKCKKTKTGTDVLCNLGDIIDALFNWKG